MKVRRLLLVDGHSLIHRAYHAYPKTLSTKSGEQTNAVYGFTRMLLTAIRELKPTHLAVAFDLPAPTFRHQTFVGYKKSRTKPDDELVEQIPRVKEVVEALNIPTHEVEGFEADDLIGTLAQKAKKNGQVTILTSDQDILQLVEGDRVVTLIPGRSKKPSKIWDQQEFEKEWGFSPKELVEYKALAGDKSDDIPGVKGIGDKGAQELVGKYGKLEKIYGHLNELKPGLVKKLAEDQEMAQLSRELATIDCHVPISLDWKEMEVHQYDKTRALKLFDELQFKSLVKMLPNDRFEQEVQEALF